MVGGYATAANQCIFHMLLTSSDLSPAIRVLRELRKVGAEVDYYDPWVPEFQKMYGQSGIPGKVVGIQGNAVASKARPRIKCLKSIGFCLCRLDDLPHGNSHLIAETAYLVVRDSAERIATYLKPGTMVVLESTTYPGTTEELIKPMW